MPGRLVGRRFRIGSPVLTAAEFLAGLAITLSASELMARGLTRLGTKAGFSEGLLGLLAALGADAPELSSAVIAIAAGAGTVGVGVVIGSNLFNIAALLGLSSVVARGVTIRRAPLLLDAVVGILILGIAAAMVAGLAAPGAAAIALVPLIGLYVAILAVPRTRLRALRPLVRGVPQSLVEIAYEVTHDRPTSRHGSWIPVLLLPLAVALVVAGAFVMVHSALDAKRSLHLSDAILGTIVLAALTSLPNLWLALHFARSDRGTALFSATMNSNSINLVGGLVVPALIVGAATAAGSLADFRWLGVMTLVAVIAPLPSGRLRPIAGGLIIAIYLVFVVHLVTGG